MERSRPAPRSIARPLVLIVLGLLVILTYILWPVLAAISLGGFIVLVAQRPFEWLVRRLGGRRRLATWLGTAAVLLAVMVPIVGIGYLAIEEAAAGVQWVAGEIDSLGGLQGVARHAPKFLRPSILHFAARGSSALGQVATRLAKMTPEILRGVGWTVAELFLALVTVFYLFREGPRFVAFVRRVTPLPPSYTETLLTEFRDVAQGLFFGNVLTALFHGALGALGFFIVGVPHVFFLGALMMIASFIPAVGTAVLWVPIAIGLLLTGHAWRGVILLAWGFVVIGAIDQIVRPLLSKGRMALPELLMFLTIFGGIAMFGLKGLLLGPLFGSLAVSGLRLVAREQSAVATPPPVVTDQP